MNKFISTLFCCLVVLPLCLRAQGTAFSNCSFESKILGRVMHFSIYLNIWEVRVNVLDSIVYRLRTSVLIGSEVGVR